MGPAKRDAIVALQRFAEPGPRHHLGVQALGRHEQDREIGGVRRRDVLVADGLRFHAQAILQRLARGHRQRAGRPAPARPAGAANPRAETWHRPAASMSARRRRARAGELRIPPAGRCRARVSTFAAYCCGVSTSASRAASWTSPHMPRVFTLASTRFRSPTPVASDCISPRPRCTCSRRSETVLNDAASRCSSVACSFSSTVARICSSLEVLSPRKASRRCSTVCRTASSRCSLAVVNTPSCSPNPCNCRCCRPAIAVSCCCVVSRKLPIAPATSTRSPLAAFACSVRALARSWRTSRSSALVANARFRSWRAVRRLHVARLGRPRHVPAHRRQGARTRRARRTAGSPAQRGSRAQVDRPSWCESSGAGACPARLRAPATNRSATPLRGSPSCARAPSGGACGCGSIAA